MVFAIGPAGTGKTYLAMAVGVSYLLDKKYSRIVLARPAVEAGEKLGFLPGDLSEKVNPYLRPLYDALFDMMDYDKATNLINKGIIEVAPLAFMRGRTLNDSFVILDEAQNTTSEQMKMFLTRLGFGSKAVITGDVTQIDLPFDKISGLVEAEEILSRINEIKFIHFSDLDVVQAPAGSGSHSRLQPPRPVTETQWPKREMKKFELASKKFNSNVLQNINDYFRGKTARELVRDFLILSFLTIILVILISPSFFSAQSENRAGTIAVEDIKADRDFLVEEKLSTEAKRSAILKITPAIYDYKPDFSLSLQSQIVQLFAMISDEINRSSIRKSKSAENVIIDKQAHIGIVRKYLNTNFGVDMTDAEFNVFYRDKFSNSSARAICRLIDKIYFDNFVIDNTLPKTDHERGIIVRNVKSQEELLDHKFQ